VVPIPVPAIVAPEVVAAVQEQWRSIDAMPGSRVAGRCMCSRLLQGQHCGYAYDGKRRSPRARQGKPRAYAMTAAWERMPTALAASGVSESPGTDRSAGRGGLAGVWTRLAHPERLAEEYRRRLQPETRAKRTSLATVEAQLGKLRQGVARLIDRYAERLIDKDEFEPRIPRLRHASLAWKSSVKRGG